MPATKKKTPVKQDAVVTPQPDPEISYAIAKEGKWWVLKEYHTVEDRVVKVEKSLPNVKVAILDKLIGKFV